MKKQCFSTIASLSVIFSINLYAESNPLTEFKTLFGQGQYQKAAVILEKNNIANENGEKFYLLGITYSKLQEYDKAISNFEEAIKLKNSNNDLYYEYGQALYAANELKAARKAFSESARLKFNESTSIYYVAHISQILEEFTIAKENYAHLLKDSKSDAKIKQISKFQLSETMLMLLREKKLHKEELEKNVEKYILPMMNQALELDKSSSAANDITQRISEIEKEFNLDPNLLKNGRRISPKRGSAYIFQKIKYDNNVTLTNEENNIQQSKAASFIFESEAYAKYDLVVFKRVISTPEVRINYVKNSDQHTPEVFQNDTYSINANLKNKFEHTLNSQPASFVFDIEYGKNYKDWKQIHTRSHYADSTTFGIGEMFSYFKLGDTSFRVKRKSYTGVNTAISNKTISAIGDQTINFPNQTMLITMFEADFVDNFNNPSSNTNTYLLRFDYIIPGLFSKYTLDLAMGTTITDTKDQKATRGTEVSYNPSIDLSREISEHTKIGLNYDFTKSNSKQSSYAYKKNIISTEFRYSF